VTGDQKAIGRLARRYQVAFAKHEIEGSGYVVDHVSKFILVGPGGEVVGSFPHGIRSDQLARAIAGALAAAEH
jgi:cytochrome oxidase Cu insertion factor (SCO1/SenC/PrrC family)